MVATEPIIGIVPRQWPGSTIVCLGTGPSLTPDQVEFCRGRAPVIAIKNAVDVAPWADVVYGAGVDRTNWWGANGARIARTHQGLRFTLDRTAAAWATVLKIGPPVGLSTSPDTLATGRHSGYSAINLAVLLGAARVLLLGYDMRHVGGKHHFFGGHPTGMVPDYREWPKNFRTLIEPLKAFGVSVINCTPGSAIDAFPTMSLSEALA